jgi:hypothetical protein
MVRTTRKGSKHQKEKGISIPELRRSFEHIESFVDHKLKKRESKDQISKDLRKEWYHVFFKTLTKSAADEFIDDRMKHYSSRTTRRQKHGKHHGGAAISGAPLDYMTRSGVYLAPGQIPTAQGHLPLSSGAPSTYGSYVQYVDKGFWNPEPAQSYDPVPGQPAWPVVPAGMGSNLVKGGARLSRKKHRAPRRGGSQMLPSLQSVGSFASQVTARPISSSSPPGILQDMQDLWHGKQVGASPDQVQRAPVYSLSK